jgi:hypothetical protein
MAESMTFKVSRATAVVMTVLFAACTPFFYWIALDGSAVVWAQRARSIEAEYSTSLSEIFTTLNIWRERCSRSGGLDRP